MGDPVDQARYYSFCNDVKESDRHGYCEGYVDQCVAHLKEVGDKDQSTYVLVSANGKRVEKLDFDRCLGFAKVVSLQGAPAKVVKGDAGKPGGSLPYKDEVRTERVKKAPREAAVPGTRPAWIDVKAPEHAIKCGASGGYEMVTMVNLKGMAELEAHARTLGHYCLGQAFYAVHGDRELVVVTDEGYSVQMKGGRLGSKPTYRSFLDRVGGQLCYHVYLDWDKIFCDDGKTYLSE